MLLLFPLNENHLLFQNHSTNIFDGAEARSYFGFIRLSDDDVFEERDNTTLTMHETDENYLSESDNIDTERLYINVNLGVVSTVYPRDRTVTHLLHKKPNTDELMANIAPPGWISSTCPHSSRKSSSTRCSRSVRT